MADIKIVAGDTGLPIQAQLLKADGTTVLADITGATVTVRIKKPGGNTIEREASILNGSLAQVDYAPTDGDFSLAGLYELRWKVQQVGGEKLSVPSNNTVKILAAKAL